MENTVRNIANSILGVALIQSILTGLAFILAGLWALPHFIYRSARNRTYRYAHHYLSIL
jgi:Na+-driven multidrug efflux pump